MKAIETCSVESSHGMDNIIFQGLIEYNLTILLTQVKTYIFNTRRGILHKIVDVEN